MGTRARRNGTGLTFEPQQIELLYAELVKLFYDEGNRRQARKVASRLEAALGALPDYAASIRGEEVRSLIAEVRGDFAEAARSREAEIRRILELHALTVNTPDWEYVSRQYDFSDVSDRLDLLAILYDAQGELDRAAATLRESKHYCQSHRIPFDAQDLLDELEESRGKQLRRRARNSPMRVKPLSGVSKLVRVRSTR